MRESTGVETASNCYAMNVGTLKLTVLFFAIADMAV